jgi:hypothetical protein
MTTIISEEITLEQVKELLPDRVNLYYVDYRDNLNERLDLFDKHLKNPEKDFIGYEIDEWCIQSDYGEDYVYNQLVRDVSDEFDLETREAAEVVDEHWDSLRDLVYKRDESTPLKDYLKNTSPVPMRISRYSNYDCINSHFFETSSGGYEYHESYFGDAVDALNLNPKKVKEALGNCVVGKFPDYEWRNGKELVDYKAFVEECYNRGCPVCLLTILATIDPMDFYDYSNKFTKFIVPAGNKVGFYSSDHGGGSMFEMELLRPLLIDTAKVGKSGYDHWGIYVDYKDNGYTISDVFGAYQSIYGEEITIK